MLQKRLLQATAILGIALSLTACPMRHGTQSGSNPHARRNTHWPKGDWLTLFQRNDLWPELVNQFSLISEKPRPAVQRRIHHIQRHPRAFAKLMKNAAPYLHHVYRETQKRGMPAEIALIPFVESNYNPFLYSKRGATGLWQMMPGTAYGYGLEIDWWYDGRRDIVASTNAALHYLTYLHKRFGTWLLAIAAYDAGEGHVKSALAYNKRHHRPMNFWALRLPRETHNYVPKILALARVLANPREYDLTLRPVKNAPYFEAISMKGQINLGLIAKLAHMHEKEIRLLNPGFRRWTTRPHKKYVLLLPKAKASDFQKNIEVTQKKPVTWLHHIVKQGDTLSHIAHKNHTSVRILIRVNGLKTDRIHIKQSLLVPLTPHLKHFALLHNTSASITEDHVPGPRRIVHEVKNHESLWSIGAHYGVKAHQIRYWNHISYHARLKTGEKLILWIKRKRSL